MQIKVVSWNIWIDGFLEKWKDFLVGADADIIGLQEVKDNDSSRDIISFLSERGYHHFFARTDQVWEGKKYSHGPAVFSKFPIIHSEKIQLEGGDDERAAAYVQVEVADTILNVFSAHLVHTHQQPSEQQDAQVRKLIEKLPPHHTMAMGDFNATPESNTIKLMRDVLIDTDLDEMPTWSVYEEGCSVCKISKLNTKLDYIFVSKDLKFNSFKVEGSDGSDHLPVSVNVGF